MNAKVLAIALILVAAIAIPASAYSVTLSPPSGWSTISTPYDADVSQLALTGIDTGVMWDGANWVTVLPYTPTTIPATSAIFVHTSSGGSITLVSVPSDEAIMSDGVASGFARVNPTLGATWNFVGVSPRIDGSWISSQKTMYGAFSGATKIISPSANDGTCWETTVQSTELDVFKGYWVKFNEGGYIRQYWV